MSLTPFIILLIPTTIHAQTLFQTAGALNIFVGLMATAAIVVFISGFGYYIARLGLHSRVEGIHIMEWGVAIVFVLIVLLALVRFIRLYTETVLAVLSFVVFIALLVSATRLIALAGKKKEKAG